MPKCPKCQKEVYFAEKVTSLGKDWHRPCLRCEKCNKTLSSGSHAELFWSLVRRNGGVTTDEAPDEAEENGDENAGHGGKPYCHNPCYSAMFGPGGFGRGGAESHKY